MQTIAECQASQALLGSRASRRFQARNADRLRARILGVSRSSKKTLAVCAGAEKQVRHRMNGSQARQFAVRGW